MKTAHSMVLIGILGINLAGVAQTLSCTPDSTGPPITAISSQSSDEHPARFFVRAGMTGAIYHASTVVSAGGTPVPGASASVANEYTVSADLGYYVSRHLAVSVLGGVPIKPTLYGAGTVASFGALGSVLYGPAIVTGAEYVINRKLALFADFKQVYLTVFATGMIGGVVPASAKLALNPSLPTGGVVYSF